MSNIPEAWVTSKDQGGYKPYFNIMKYFSKSSHYSKEPWWGPKDPWNPEVGLRKRLLKVGHSGAREGAEWNSSTMVARGVVSSRDRTVSGGVLLEVEDYALEL